MNKKFFTLAAAFGLAASSFTAGATTTVKDLKSGEYYQLIVGDKDPTASSAPTAASSYYISTHNQKTDSLILTAAGSAIYDDASFWKVEYVDGATGREFTFVNKATGKKMSFAKLAKDKASNAIVSASGEVATWKWGDGISNSANEIVTTQTAGLESGALTNAMGGASYNLATYNDGSHTVLALVNGDAGTVLAQNSYVNGVQVQNSAGTQAAYIYAVQPDPQALTVKELNDIKGGNGFELAFDPAAGTNIFTGKTIQAIGVNGTSVTVTSSAADGSHATLIDNSTSADAALATDGNAASQKAFFLKVAEKENGAKKKVAMCLVVDTVLVNGVDKFGFASDSVIVAEDKNSILAAPGRDLSNYLFTVKKDYATGKLTIMVADVPVIPATGKTWAETPRTADLAAVTLADGLNVTDGVTRYVYTDVLGSEKATTLTANATVAAATAITFKTGTAVKDLNTKVAYFVQPVNEDGEVEAKYYVATKTSTENLTAAAASDYIPSTQWNLVSLGGNNYELVNRETGFKLYIGAGNVTGPTYVIDAAKGIYSIGGKKVALVARADVKGENVGYKEFSDSDVKFKKIALKLNTFGTNPVYLALKSDKDSVVVASEDAAKKIEFKLVANEYKAFGDVENDSLVRTSYALKSGDLYLAYDYNLQSYKLSKLLNGGNTVTSNAVVNETMDPAKAPQNDTVYVYFQNVGKDAYALVPELVYTATDASTSFTAAGYYGNSAAWATAAAGLRKEFGIYNTKLVVNSNGTVKNVDFGDSMNSSFEIEDGTPEYDKTIQKPAHQMITLSTDKAMALTITSDNFAAMKRVGQELKADYAADNLKMYVDTATMADVNKPLYYITTGQNVPAECQAKGERNYLISLQDSSEVEGYTSEGLSRVGFVHGVVDADTITLFKGHTVAADTVVIKNNHANVANWAFTANEDGSVSLENQKKGEFIAFRNDVLVMVGSLEEAAQFTMEAVEAPTANDAAPSVTEVKVIAANGAIQVIGAQGKKVVVTNILGQTIANTVLTSSDATIAAPAGVVVVAVEGEEAVKAIVK